MLHLDGDYSTANFTASPFDGFATTITDQGPVISATHMQVSANSGSTTLTGLSISDFFDLSPSDLFTITATVGSGTLGLVTPADDPNVTSSGNSLSGTGTLSEINAALSHGLIYTPTGSPGTDHFSVTIEDANHAMDEINFVFNQAGSGPNVSLTGTAGKDVLYGTGYNDTFTGGASSDSFVFRQFAGSGTSTDHITDFNVFQDYLDVGGGNFANVAALLAATHDVAGSAVITVDAHNSITLNNVTSAQLSAHQDHLLVA